MDVSRAVLITGCGSGIGRATALALHRAGYPVYATARSLDPAAVGDLVEQGIRVLRLDVTDESSMRAAVQVVEEEHGAVGVLVNNAGVGLSGTIEESDLKVVREELFEVNLFGLVRMTQLVLPGMRAQRFGTIVNISSIFGRFAVAGGGYYHATKHAVEAISDALRLETAAFGVRVVVLAPATVRTSFGVNTRDGLGNTREGLTVADGGVEDYRAFRDELASWYREVEEGRRSNVAARLAISPEVVAAAVERAVRHSRPRPRYRVGLLANALLMLRDLLPDRPWQGFVRARFPTPGRPTGSPGRSEDRGSP